MEPHTDRTRERSVRRERAVWIGVTAVIVAALLAVLIPVRAFAQSQDSESERLLSMFEEVFRLVQQNYVEEPNAEELIQGALDGMFESLDDPHSAYLTPEEFRDLTDTTQGRFGGVGMYISKQDSEDGDTEGDEDAFVEVYSAIEDTPAYRAGVRAGDLIVAIEEKSTKKLDMDEVVSRLRGSPGSTVTITIRRGEQKTFPLTLERAIIEVPTVKHAMIPENIAFLRIIQFTPYTADRVKEAIKSFEDQGYEKMIIDVRHNPGGVLNSVVDTADLFFEDGLLVGTRGRMASENQRFTADSGREVPADIPIVVLIDGGSASAAEILAGALKDRDRAYLMGQTTYGKGSVQQVSRLQMGGLRMTTAKYYTPDGTYIEGSGVSPHKVVQEPQLSDEELDAYSNLRASNTIVNFVERNNDPSEEEVQRFVDRLQQEEDVPLSDRRLEKMVRDEVHRANNTTSVYDLEYDVVLQEAVELLRSGELPTQ